MAKIRGISGTAGKKIYPGLDKRSEAGNFQTMTELFNSLINLRICIIVWLIGIWLLVINFLRVWING